MRGEVIELTQLRWVKWCVFTRWNWLRTRRLNWFSIRYHTKENILFLSFLFSMCVCMLVNTFFCVLCHLIFDYSDRWMSLIYPCHFPSVHYWSIFFTYTLLWSELYGKIYKTENLGVTTKCRVFFRCILFGLTPFTGFLR